MKGRCRKSEIHLKKRGINVELCCGTFHENNPSSSRARSIIQRGALTSLIFSECRTINNENLLCCSAAALFVYSVVHGCCSQSDKLQSAGDESRDPHMQHYFAGVAVIHCDTAKAETVDAKFPGHSIILLPPPPAVQVPHMQLFLKECRDISGYLCFFPLLAESLMKRSLPERLAATTLH